MSNVDMRLYDPLASKYLCVGETRSGLEQVFWFSDLPMVEDAVTQFQQACVHVNPESIFAVALSRANCWKSHMSEEV